MIQLPTGPCGLVFSINLFLSTIKVFHGIKILVSHLFLAIHNQSHARIAARSLYYQASHSQIFH